MAAHPSLAEAEQALRRGDIDGAVSRLRARVAESADDVDALRALALLLQQRGGAAEAATLLDAAAARRPDDAALQFSLGLARMAAGEHAGAVGAFDAALARRPEAATAWLNRGVALRWLERTREAAESFERAAALAPEQVEPVFNLGICRLREGQVAEALEALERAAALAPRVAAVQHGFGNALREAGRTDEALAAFERAIALDPRHSDALTDAGMCLLGLGRAAEARGHLERAIALSPGDQTALSGLYVAAHESGEDALAASLMDYERLLGRADLTTDALDPSGRAAMVEAVLALPDLIEDPLERTTRGGRQSGTLPTGEGSPFAPLVAAISRAIDAHLARLAADVQVLAHPWWRARPSHWKLSLWATVLGESGHQRPHLHPAGWLSGVCYLRLGMDDDEPEAGWLEFGRPPDALLTAREPLVQRVRPAEGALHLFPSYFFHRTLPYRGEGLRISIAFDLVPG